MPRHLAERRRHRTTFTVLKNSTSWWTPIDIMGGRSLLSETLAFVRNEVVVTTLVVRARAAAIPSTQTNLRARSRTFAKIPAVARMCVCHVYLMQTNFCRKFGEMRAWENRVSSKKISSHVYLHTFLGRYIGIWITAAWTSFNCSKHQT